MLGELEVLLGPGEVSPSKGIDLFLCGPESGLGSPDSPQASTSDIRTLAGPAPPPLRPTGFPTGKLAMASSVVQGQEDRRGK